MNEWIPTDKELPGNPRCVLATTDGECHFIACHEAHGKDCDWVNAHNGEAIDSHITHWMELPEVPNE